MNEGNVVRFPLERRIEEHRVLHTESAEVIHPDRWKVELPADVEQSD